MSFEFKVEGLDALVDNLRKFTAKVEVNILRSAMQAGAQYVAKQIRRNAPRGQRGGKKKTGRKTDVSLIYGPIRRQVKAKRRNPKRGRVGSLVTMGRAFYWRFIEYGTAERQRENGGSTGSIQPQPFVRPAWESSKEAVQQIILQKLRANIDKQVRKVK